MYQILKHIYYSDLIQAFESEKKCKLGDIYRRYRDNTTPSNL